MDGADNGAGRLLRAARVRLGLTQLEVARKAGLSVGALRDLEQGRSRRPRASSVRALIDALGLGLPDRRLLYALAAPRRADPEPAGTGPIRIGVLGPLLVSRSGAAVTLGSGRQRVVLARLALTPNHAVSTTELTRLVWAGGRPPATAANVLQTHVSRLRALLGDDDASTIVLTPGGYRLSATDDEIDLIAYRHRLRSWRQTAPADPQRAFDLLHEALDVWRADTAVPDVHELETDPLVAGLTEELVEATVQLGHLGESLRRLPEVLPRLRRLANRHPWHEGLHARLIVALAASGQQAAALTAYESIRRRLIDELGIDPGGELLDAHGSLLRPPRAEPAATPLPLPAPPADFVGRAEQIDHLQRLLRRGGGRPVTCVVSGMPGVGKTSLVLQAVRAVRDDFPESPLHLDLRGTDERPVSPRYALSRLLQALGVNPRRIPGDDAAAAALYQDVLSERRALIVLDNAAGADQVRPLLPGRGRSAVLITSRNECAGLTAEHLAVPVLSVGEALDLLGHRIGPARVAADRDAAVELVEACGRLPVALRVVDPGWSVRDLLGETGAGPAFHLSYRRLGIRAAEIFRAASLIPGESFGAAAVAAVAGGDTAEVAAVLRGLAEENLLLVVADGRYGYHDLLRRYSEQRLIAVDSPAVRSAALGRLCDFYLIRTAGAMRLAYASMVRLPTAVDDRPVGFDGIDGAMAWLDEEADTLVALIEAVAGGEHRQRAWELADQLRGYFFLRGDVARWLAAGHAGLVAADRAGDQRARAAMFQTIGQAHWSARRHEPALDAYHRGVAAATAGGWPVCQAYLLHNIGLVHSERGEVAEARRLYHEALAVCAGAEFRHIRAVTLNDLGALCTEQGLLTEAAEHFRSALALNTGAVRRPSANVNRANLGMVLRQLKDFDAAQEHLNTSLEYERATGSLLGELSTLDELSQLYREQGELSAAVDAAEEGLRLAVRLDDPRAQACLHNTLGFALLAARAVADARTRFETAARLGREGGFPYFEAQAGIGLARTALMSGETAEARSAAGAALAMARSRDYRLLVGDAQAVLDLATAR